MTLNGAIMELVMLSEHPMMPVIFKPSIQKIIETVSECEESERKPGKWIPIDIRWYRCSECGAVREHKSFMGNFCPNCGAKMEVSNGRVV